MILLLGGSIGLALSFLVATFLADRALVPIGEAFRRQQEFVADVSHELRTPLTILHSATDLLKERCDEPLHMNKGLLDEVRPRCVLLDKHTPPGGQVRLLVGREGTQGVLRVEDAGDGIPRRGLKRASSTVSTPIDRAHARATGGAGLGLAIAHALVVAHGGGIALSNRSGGGALATI